MEAGQLFYEVQVGTHVGSAGFGGIQAQHTTSSSAATLGEIEKLGWHLEHAGYYFMSGDATAVSGVTVGVYLFRNTRA
jgi:hypothetical protein